MTTQDRDGIAIPSRTAQVRNPAPHHPSTPRSVRPGPSTPTERGDGDYEGSASSLARQNAPREAKGGQSTEAVLPAQKPERVALKGVKG